MNLEFEVLNDEEGGYAAACFSERIYTEGKDLEELYENIHRAIDECFTDRPKPSSDDVKLIFFGAQS